MVKKPLLIIHGWSGRSEHLVPLSDYLKKTGFKVVDIWLADYLSMNDEITIQDLGQAMGKALRDKKISEDPKSFDVIVHSTGGLVIRQYLLHYFYCQPERCPVNRLVMLAPANFGSPLAHLGKSMIGRLAKGWKWNGKFQSGTKVLDALELGSSISWQLAVQDLFNSENQVFRTSNVLTTILIGSDSYTDTLGRMNHENGSDGTVRPACANLNASYLKVAFKEPASVDVVKQDAFYDPFAFAVLYKHNHSTITRPDQESILSKVLLDSLSIETEDDHKAHLDNLAKITKETFAKGMKSEDRNKYHQYQHIVARVHDQFGEGIQDYFLEFFQEKRDKDDKVMEKIHKEILEKVWPYSKDKSYRSFFFDITDLRTQILDQKHCVDMSICASKLSDHIRYCNTDKTYFPVASSEDETLLNPNTTTLVDITLPRIQEEDVFSFRKV